MYHRIKLIIWSQKYHFNGAMEEVADNIRDKIHYLPSLSASLSEEFKGIPFFLLKKEAKLYSDDFEFEFSFAPILDFPF